MVSLPPKNKRIGDLMVENGVITSEDLRLALIEQKRSGLKLGQVLIRMKIINESNLLEFISKSINAPIVELRNIQLNHKLARILPESVAKRTLGIVLEEIDAGYLVGMADPNDLVAFDEIRQALKSNIKVAIVAESELLEILGGIYRRSENLSVLASELARESGESVVDLQEVVRTSLASDAPVSKILQSIFEDAVNSGASDIHIEPDENYLRIRLRIDGYLHEQLVNEKSIAIALTSKLKIMAGLNISERRLPQDGAFDLRIVNKKLSVRLSTLPSIHGEAVVMRLLDPSKAELDMAMLGMPQIIMDQFEEAIRRPYGMILVTGPTGSGKTTTLYSALQKLNHSSTKIITAEDPVEYRISRVQQVQVNAKIGLDFTTILRNIVRQDPDVVLIGEMRDQETVDIAIRAALTGHLVLSTLHTNNAPSSAIRLINMGAQGYVIGDILLGIMAQRLIRRVCTRCRIPHELDASELNWIKKNIKKEIGKAEFVTGRGCVFCHFTGYHGRIGCYEYLAIDQELANALRSNLTSEFIDKANQKAGYTPFWITAFEHACEGIVSLEEVVRITGAM
ncbi:MAG: Flp pilus assembly complex ATPase component TadA [Magnetococcales bacterium]|nr:Flp pilus assembly complex ATPase component TadA [Magnetococcales bacterium]